MRTATSASWTLPASKTEVTALGGTVSHGCCRWRMGVHEPSPLCPYHSLYERMWAQFKKYRSRFHTVRRGRPGYPLFPDNRGEVYTKAGVMQTIRMAARRPGHELVDPGGLFLHWGHAVRVAGAQALSRVGLSQHTIALLARWDRPRCYPTSARLPWQHRAN